jgi:hypothetical protein
MMPRANSVTVDSGARPFAERVWNRRSLLITLPALPRGDCNNY